MSIVTGRIWRIRSWLPLFLGLVTGSGFPAHAQNPAPILVVTNSADPFSGYYSEILLAEGLNEFTLQDVATLSSATLAQFDVAILGEVALTASQVGMFTDWVNAGGALIAMRPDKQLAGLLGLVDAGTSLAEGYLLVNTASGPGVGIVGQTIQFHGTADQYTLGGASAVATLYSDAQTATPNPAVTLRSVGVNGGQAGAFTFGLARSVVYTRQGNPAWSGEQRNDQLGQSGDGQLDPIRAVDLFYGPASFDPQPDWVDLNNVAIPQADEQQRLLANLVITMDAHKKPLPRFWYFPHGYKAVVVMTGDDHAGTYGGSYASTRFDQYLAASPVGGSVDDWTVPRCTAYTFVSPSPSLTNDAQAAAYDAAGFEIGMHLNTGCADYTASALDTFFTDQIGQFSAMYPSLPGQTTHRIHCIAWSDYSTPASVSRAHGIRLETSYYYWPPVWVADRPGFFTGSGMPMRFTDTNGAIMDIYQATTQMTDESGQSYPYTVDTLLDRALGPEGYYGAFVANMHTDTYPEPEADAIFSSATNRGVPIISSRQLLAWLDARNASTIESINWSSNRETFSIQAAANASGLQAMVPVPGGSTVSSVLCNGDPLAYNFNWIKGIQYAVFSGLTGDYEVSFATNSTPPTITITAPGNGVSGVSPGTSISVGFSEAMDATSINTNTIILSNSSGTLLPASVSYNPSTRTGVLVPSTPLALANTYTAVVKGGAGAVTDVGGIPLAGDFSWSFATATQYPSNIWPSAAVPAQADAGVPDGSVELGVKFRSAIDGKITGIRFYKAAANTNTHVGNLWSSTGTLLATATFSGETASGWQQVQFSSPVGITSNTVYVASYHCNNGHYSADASYFYGFGVDNYPLHALTDGESGGDGVYAYGSTSVFPNQTYHSENYWVDVVFQAGPVVTVSPGTTNVECGSTIVLTANATGAGTLSYQWSDNQTNLLSGETGQTLTLTNVHLADAGNYTVVVTDSDGAATNFAVVYVVDTTAPVVGWSFTNLTVSADTNCQALMPDVTGTNYILAVDACSSVLTITQTPTSNAVLGLGANEVVLTVADGNGNMAYSTNTVIVADLTTPVITLLGASPLTNECHTAFVDPGATALGICSGVVSLSTNSTVNPNAVGVYMIEYAAGNLATNTRQVYVVDTTAPVVGWSFTNLTVSADTNCQALMPDVTGTNYILAADACSSVLTITQTPTNNTVLGLGTNEVVLAVTDDNGNTAYSTNTVVVSTAPVITLLGASPLTNECHTALVDPGATVLDNCSGVVNLSTNSTVNPNAVGVYTIEYVAGDAAGNSATNTRQVYVVDTTAPVITQCAPAQTVTAGYNGLAILSNLTSLVVATDACSSSVNIAQQPPAGTEVPVGTNMIEFYVDDGNGNTNTCTSTVTVNAATLEAPTIISGHILGNHSFELTFSGPDAQPYEVQASANPTNPPDGWDVLTNSVFGTGPATFIDTGATSQTMRFYRVVSP